MHKVYREGSWNVQQLVHHTADSQLDMYQRLKLALTDDHPTIVNYDIMESIVAAECMGWGDTLGTLEEGKLADVVVTKKDPIANIASLENTDNINTVILDGEIVKDLR